MTNAECQQRFRKNHKKKCSDYTRDYYRKNKLELINYLGGECVHCGLKPINVEGCLGVFVIDEIIPLGIGKRKFSSLTKKKLIEAKQLTKEGKIQLLCQNCSAVKTWKNGDYATRF